MMSYYDPTFNDPTLNSVLNEYDKSQKATDHYFEKTMATLIRQFAHRENKSRTQMGNPNLITVTPCDKTDNETYGADIMFHDESGLFGHNGTIRFDVTHAFSEKNNIPFVKASGDPLIIEGLYNHNYQFQYGIRIGNPRANFEEPVIVIGFDMTASEYEALEDDRRAQENFTKNICEIVNMSNGMLQSFYYQVDEETRKAIDAKFAEDERPDTELLAVNPKYLKEVGRYASRRWTLPEDTKLAKQSRELILDIYFSAEVERLSQKYEEQAFSKVVTDLSKDGGRAP